MIATPLRILGLMLCILAFGCKSDPKPDAAAATPSTTATTGTVDPDVFFYTEKIKANPTEDSLYYLRANAYYKSEGFDEAISDLQRAISLDTTHVEYFHLLADCYLDYFKSFPAIQTLEEAHRRWPERIPTMLKLSEFYLIVQKHGEALKMVQEVMKYDPQNSEAFFMASMIAKDKNQIPLAIKNMERSVAINPESVDGWIILGNLLSGKNDEVAIRYYQNALRLDTTSMEAHDGIATFYHKAGQLDKAEAAYRDMVIKEPSRPETYYDLGLLYLEQEKTDLAEQHMKMSIDQDPLFFKAIYYIGVIAEKKGNLELARTQYDQASRMVTDYKDAIDALARVEALIKKQGNAKK
jgi:tetratricopeptide (TPR) repeat protein